MQRILVAALIMIISDTIEHHIVGKNRKDFFSFLKTATDRTRSQQQMCLCIKKKKNWYAKH